MWGILVGVGLGILQVWLLRKTAEWITADKRKGTMVAVPVILLKLGAIMGTLYLLALADRTLKTIMFGAGGLLVTMIVLSIVLNRRQVARLRKEGDQDERT